MLGRVKVWAALVFSAVAAILFAFLRGKSAGRNAAELARAKRNIAAIKAAREVEDEVVNYDDDALRAAARKWVRED